MIISKNRHRKVVQKNGCITLLVTLPSVDQEVICLCFHPDAAFGSGEIYKKIKHVRWEVSTVHAHKEH
jgi:hypothetical protein